jgi:uncharacterized membrane protein YhaH (DUF805 family)
MKYLKERFGYYFQFKNTLNGTDYFFRGLGAVLFFFPIGIFVGIGIALIAADLKVAGIISIVLGSLFIIPMFWFSLATTYKRINAFFPGKAGWLLAVTFVYNLLVEGLNPNQSLNLLDEPAPTLPNGDYITFIVFAIPGLIWSLYLLFGNSKVKKHIG